MNYANIPQDPVMLLSFINMKLRDECQDLAKLCNILDINKEDIENKLATINYHFDPATHQFK